jgi:outer membrane protein OmpA-like peptidoglycan-associated protein
MQNITFAALVASAVMGSASPAAADEYLTAVIAVRGDSTLTVAQEKDGTLLIVNLTVSTKIRSGGKAMSASDLIPGLRVRLDGGLSANNRLVAKTIEFTHEDQTIAEAVRAGLTLTQQTLRQQGTAIAANDLKVVGTTGARASRIYNLDDFNVVDTLVVYFKDGLADVSPDSAAQLREFGARAKTVHGYQLQVQGYASDKGSTLSNEVLSLRRAHAVAGVLVQHAAVPPPNVFVPGGLVFSEQVVDITTAKGQSKKRFVIVTILQSKGQSIQSPSP